MGTCKVPGKRYVITSGAQKAPAYSNNFMLNNDNKQKLPEFLVEERSKGGAGYSDIQKISTNVVIH